MIVFLLISGCYRRGVLPPAVVFLMYLNAEVSLTVCFHYIERQVIHIFTHRVAP